MTREINNLLFLTLFLIITSCSSDVIYTDAVAMKKQVWELSHVPEFTIPVSDTVQMTDISFTIRTGSDYPFRNLWLFITAYSPDGKSISDTLEYELADEKGNWYGKGFGDIHELTLPYRSKVFFPVTGPYRFKIQHGMRTGNLAAVYDFGLRIVETSK
ncbi:MAG: gliding motility lipoprotein GldH [Bacteroidota bacterium]